MLNVLVGWVTLCLPNRYFKIIFPLRFKGKNFLAKLCMVTICLLEWGNTIKITLIFCVNN